MFDKRINTSMIVPTSKIALKTSCIEACNGDLDKAAKLYEYFVADLPDLPDFSPAKPTIVEQAKNVIGDTFEWLETNQDKFSKVLGLIKGLKSGPSAQPVEGVPPIPNE